MHNLFIKIVFIWEPLVLSKTNLADNINSNITNQFTRHIAVAFSDPAILFSIFINTPQRHLLMEPKLATPNP